MNAPSSKVMVERRIIYLSKIFALALTMSCTAVALSDRPQSVKKRNLGKSFIFAKNELYKTECGSCHLAFLPGFLPKNSWEKLMSGLEDHFGENAELEEPQIKEINKFLFENAAGAPKSSSRSKKINRVMEKMSDLPIRITETPFWVRKHYSIKKWVWKREAVASKAKCEACHEDAIKGRYSEYTVNIPD
jgi:hypothetical protein